MRPVEHWARAPPESCIDSAFVNVGALNREWLAAGRLDWNISDRHRIFFRVTDDQGEQPSFVSLINPAWNMVSIQPNYTGQLNDIYSFTPKPDQSIYRVLTLHWRGFRAGKSIRRTRSFAHRIQRKQ